MCVFTERPKVTSRSLFLGFCCLFWLYKWQHIGNEEEAQRWHGGAYHASWVPQVGVCQLVPNVGGLDALEPCSHAHLAFQYCWPPSLYF